MHHTPRPAPLAAAAVVLSAALAFGAARGQTGAASNQNTRPASLALTAHDQEAAHGAEQNGPPSDEDLKTFAEIYAALQKADAKFEREMATAGTVEEARAAADAHQRARDDALTSHGWTRSKFDSVASAIDADPALTERAIELFDEDS